MGSTSIDEMMISLPKTEQVILKHLRALVHECLPTATEKVYEGLCMPFYKHHKVICFIWPSSVSWQVKKKSVSDKRESVRLGFYYGNLMSNEDGVLLAEGRKQIHVMYFHSLKEINDNQVRALLFEAGMIDDAFAKKKRKPSTRKINKGV
jgi:hypothetical protein